MCGDAVVCFLYTYTHTRAHALTHSNVVRDKSRLHLGGHTHCASRHHARQTLAVATETVGALRQRAQHCRRRAAILGAMHSVRVGVLDASRAVQLTRATQSVAHKRGQMAADALLIVTCTVAHAAQEFYELAVVVHSVAAIGTSMHTWKGARNIAMVTKAAGHVPGRCATKSTAAAKQ